jgi:hypothetical protein
MKRLIAIAALLFVLGISSPIYSIETIAVLEAVVEEPIPAAAKNVIADIFSEIFVLSDQYLVVDRTTIQKVLEEQSFQLSGAVSDQEIARVGEILGADIVVVARASRLGQRYFLSAKMIDVESAQIRQQQSQELSGDEEILFDLAAIVGKKLIGLEIEVYVTREGRVVTGKPETIGSSIGVSIGYHLKVGQAADESKGGIFGSIEYLYQFSSRFGLGGWVGLGPFAWLETTGEVRNQYYIPLFGLKLLFLDKVKGFGASLDLGLLPGVTLYYRNFLAQLRYFPNDEDSSWLFGDTLGFAIGYSYFISR